MSPSETHEELYRKLLETTVVMKGALLGENLEAIPELVLRHQEVMSALEATGLSDNPDLIPLVTRVEDEVRQVVTMLQGQRDKRGEDLRTFRQQRKQAAAYTAVGNRTGPQK